MITFAKLLQRAVALLGLAAMLWVAARLGAGGTLPEWLWPAFIGWCVGVPYWHYVEYRLFAPDQERERQRFLEQQALSRTAWLGGALVLAVALLRR